MALKSDQKGFPATDIVRECVDHRDAETLTEVMKQSVVVKKEHPLRIGCIQHFPCVLHFVLCGSTWNQYRQRICASLYVCNDLHPGDIPWTAGSGHLAEYPAVWPMKHYREEAPLTRSALLLYVQSFCFAWQKTVS